jgi:hypothetical protein
MGSMSASDAAPLPRLGEVYFDVRGESRSMRLSWYADTGVAVFSIWQGGTCTGTFRLPIADLPRMIQALQRGPDGGARSAGEQPTAGQAQHGGSAREPQPGMPDSDIGAGQAATAVHRPRSGRHHGDDRTQVSYAANPAAEYREEPSTGYLASGYADGPGSGQPAPRHGDGYQDELDAGHPAASRPGGYPAEPSAPGPAAGPGGGYRDELGEYSGGRASGGYRDELTAEYTEKPGSGYSGSRRASGYANEPGAGYSGSRRATHRAAYEDEPTGVYREGDPLYSGSGPDRGYEPEPARSYPGDGPPGAYSDDSLPGAGPAYHDDGLPGRDDSLPGRYEPEPSSPYPGGRPGRYEPERTAAYPAGRYKDEPTGVYRGDMLHEGYEDELGRRYPAGDSTGDHFTSDYPTGPGDASYPGAGYPGASDRQDHPALARDEAYSPARPYVSPRSRRAADPFEDGGADEPQRSRGRGDDDDPGPGSFPYGAPPSERPAGGRAR